jgi:alkylated DNA repair dioxygenase AlkB
MKSTVTLTFGDQAENHAGMQKIGQLADSGFDYNDLIQAKTKFEAIGCQCELVDLVDKYLSKKYNAVPAYVLVIRNAINKLIPEGADEMLKEQNGLVPDKKAFMYGRVVNKNARYNLCFDEKEQKADYEKGKGTIIAFDKVPLLSQLREKLSEYLGDKAKELAIEGNYYYDIRYTGIGWHGDSERKKVIAVRLGATIPLQYHWFKESQPIGKSIRLTLNHGDIYVMSEKATGFDWKQKLVPTLRHAAGAKKFLEIKKS